MRIISLLLLVSVTACSSVSTKTSTDSPPTAAAAMQRLYVGMPESEVLEVMKPVSLNWGREVYGGTGNGALIFQLSDTKQVRIEVDQNSRSQFEIHNGVGSLLKLNKGWPQWFVRYIGEPEPKTTWVLDANHYFR